jgi:hypothetical protein
MPRVVWAYYSIVSMVLNVNSYPLLAGEQPALKAL